MDDGTPAILVTRDIVIRIQAQMMGVPAEDFTTDQVSGSTGLYTGRSGDVCSRRTALNF